MDGLSMSAGSQCLLIAPVNNIAVNMHGSAVRARSPVHRRLRSCKAWGRALNGAFVRHAQLQTRSANPHTTPSPGTREPPRANSLLAGVSLQGPLDPRARHRHLPAYEVPARPSTSSFPATASGGAHKLHEKAASAACCEPDASTLRESHLWRAGHGWQCNDGQDGSQDAGLGSHLSVALLPLSACPADRLIYRTNADSSGRVSASPGEMPSTSDALGKERFLSETCASLNVPRRYRPPQSYITRYFAGRSASRRLASAQTLPLTMRLPSSRQVALPGRWYTFNRALRRHPTISRPCLFLRLEDRAMPPRKQGGVPSS
ncbi:hypothetical protein CC78DRAFT_583367 [Lojkania enalia]|uniref:Uncharacterized protein n=1 Tax=Lojkania enalia TaxID=147567 RepID=A0A9P4N1M5_9PLEO|nr:hypothetical protein CC78DRAFT_583367 [Didymosphaeria enalia]